MNFKILTLFPNMYPGPLAESITGKALKDGIWNIEAIDIRNYTHDNHKTVDDIPFGGGQGMVIKPDILGPAIEDVTAGKPENYEIIYFSPRGSLLNQKKIVEFVNKTNILLVSGRYEGIDQRVIDKYKIKEISIGDYVISGGELASFVFIDSILRLVPGILGSSASLEEESFAVGTAYENLLEYPHYTRPASWEDMEVPEVLRSGNHKKIDEWRKQQAEKLTKERRKDIWERYLRK